MKTINTSSAASWQKGLPEELFQQVQRLAINELISAFNRHASQRGLCTGLNQPLRCVPQEQLPSDIAYETFIAQTGCVPTRDNLHDRYNALMWLTAPKTKALLNRLQHEEIVRLGGVSHRGPARDALTVWDENLAVIVVNESADLLKELLATHNWSSLFLQHRSKWHSHWHVHVFGHALMEKLCTPFKAITAHAVVIQGDVADWAALDQILSEWLSDRKDLTSRIFSPLPVMGIPGWCAENENPEFYNDRSVFRV